MSHHGFEGKFCLYWLVIFFTTSCGLINPTTPVHNPFMAVNEVVLDLGNKSSYELKLDSIERASKSIELAMLIYYNDYSSSHLTQHILDKARYEGVKVRLLIDWARALPLKDFFKMLIAKGNGNLSVGYFRPVPPEGIKDLTSFGVRNPMLFLEGVLTLDFAKAIAGFRAQDDSVSVQTGALGFFSYLKNLSIHPKTWWNMTKRLHHKLIVVDDRWMMGGGRNIQDPYHWDYDHPLRLKDEEASKNNLIFMDADFLVDSDVLALQSLQTFERYWQCGIDPMTCHDPYLVVMENSDLSENEIEVLYQTLLAKSAEYEAERDYQTTDTIQDEVFVAQGAEVAYFENTMLPIQSNGTDYTQLETNYFQEEWERLIDEVGEGEEIIIHNAYVFFSSSLLLTIMRAIKERSVKITILTNSPESSNHGFVSKIGRYQYIELLKLGNQYNNAITIHEYQTKRTLHNKITVLGNQYLMISGVNADPRSQYLDTNNGITIKDEQIVLAYSDWVRALIVDLTSRNLMKNISLQTLAEFSVQRHAGWQKFPGDIGDFIIKTESWLQKLISDSFIDPNTSSGDKKTQGEQARYVLDKFLMQL